MNRLSVLSAITSTQQRLKLYNRVPTNGLVLYCGTVLTEDGKEKQVWARAAARMAPLAGLCAGHHMLRMPLSGGSAPGRVRTEHALRLGAGRLAATAASLAV